MEAFRSMERPTDLGRYPVAGGQYSWVAILAPSSVARPFSYVCGWFMLIGILCMGAVNNFVATNFILGTAQLNYGFTIERWHTVLVAYLITFIAAASNAYLPHILNKLSKGIFVWNMLSFVVCLVTILATNKNKQSAKYVFSDFQNSTGWNAPYAACLGILQGAFGMCCYDAPAHMTEEIKNARKQAPRAIIMSVYIGFFTGFIWLIALCFCIGDLETTAGTATGVPVIEIMFNSTGSIAGASVLASMIAVIATVCANSLMAEGSRAVYAFARDNGLPFSAQLSRVSSRSVPVNAVILTAVVQMAFNSIYFGTTTGFNTIIAIATQGFCKLRAPIVKLFSDTYRPILPDASLLPHPRTLHRQKNASRRPILARSLGHCAQHHRLHISLLRLHHCQSTFRYTRG
jgi:amino acid transporter